jgi:hypothetical protein
VAGQAYLDDPGKTFFDVAKDSPLLRGRRAAGRYDHKVRSAGRGPASPASAGWRCQNVLVGSSAAKGNGYVLARLRGGQEPDPARSEVEQVLETDRQAGRAGLGEGGLAAAFKSGARPDPVRTWTADMNIYVDNRLAPRSFKTPR